MYKCHECEEIFENYRIKVEDCTPGTGTESSFCREIKVCPHCESWDFDEVGVCERCGSLQFKKDLKKEGKELICEDCRELED